ncbi:MAG TPA: biotin carboxylase N-terminal domain-containing protein [Burkholderiales bacterium]|nr:biotin carboxylase N-terminal domain-containing protein [Burkholderiales bacterium]
MKFRSLLIANRGEIALRVMRTAKRMGLRTIAVYSDADRDAPHVRAADAAVHIGGSTPKDSYLNIDAILLAARSAGADAVHPGYGFLSESEKFASEVQNNRLVWIGPPPAAIRAMGDKANAKAIAAKAGVPVLPTYEKDPEFPVMVKALAGGGGRGIRIVLSKEELPEAMRTAQSEAEHAFGDGRVLLEKALLAPRHVEVQIFADGRGHCIHLGERDCSVQRRHQKIVEESPSPAVDAKLRSAMGEAAIKAARAVGYVGAGTVEFLLEDGKFWFREMNTRLQVEHPVTEAVTGYDLVEWQLRVADGEPLPARQEDVKLSGHAIEVRLCAEDPERDFLPQAGTLALWRPSQAVRVDHALESGTAIPPYYDSMLAKFIAHAPTRDAARTQLAAALDETVADGIPTNKAFLAAVLRDSRFGAGKATTEFLSTFDFAGAQAGFGEWAGWSNNPAHRSRGSERFFERNASDNPARHKAASDGRLVAPMNGRVVAVNAKAGETLAAGQALVVLEAMKMEHGLALPFSVVIKAIHVETGHQVAPNKLLVEFEPA